MRAIYLGVLLFMALIIAWLLINPPASQLDLTQQHKTNMLLQNLNQQGRFSDSLLHIFQPSAHLKTNFAALYYAALSNREIARYQGHKAAITQVAFSPDGKKIASADELGHIHLYNADGSGAVSQWQADQQTVYQLVFSPNAEQLVSLSVGGILRLWRLRDGTVQTLARGQNYVRFHPSGAYFISVDNKTATLWQYNGKRLNQFETQSPVHYLDFSADGEKLLSLGQDQFIRVWQLTALSKTAIEVSLQNLLEGHTGQVHHASFDASGDYLLSGGEDLRLRLWNLHNNGQLLQLETPSPILQVGFRAYKQGFIALSATALQTWNQQGLPLTQYALSNSLAFYPSSQAQLWIGLDGRVKHWQFSQNNPASFKLAMPILGADYDAKTQHLLTYNRQIVQIWQVQAQKLAPQYLSARGIQTMRLSPDKKWLALATDKQGVWLQSLDASQPPIPLHKPDSPVYSLLFSPDGQQLFLGTQTGQIEHWQWRDQQALSPLDGHKNAVVQLSLRPDGQQFLSRGLDNKLMLWSLEGNMQAEIQISNGELIDSGYVSKHQIYAVNNDLLQKKYQVYLWDEHGKTQQQLDIAHAIQAVHQHPQHQQLAVGDEKGGITIYTWDHGQPAPILRQLAVHHNAISQLIYSPDGRYLFSSALDGSAILWQTKNYQQLQNLPHNETWINQAQFSPNSDYLLTHDYLGNSDLWQLEPLQKHLSWHSNQDIAIDDSLFSAKHLWLRRQDTIEKIPFLREISALKAYAKTQLPILLDYSNPN